MLDDGSSGSDESESETESLSPNKRKRKDQEYEPTDDEGSLSESEDELDEHEEEVLEDAPVVPDNIDMDEEEYALQQVLGIREMAFRVYDQIIRIEVDSVVHRLFSFTAPPCASTETVNYSICFLEENGLGVCCIYVVVSNQLEGCMGFPTGALPSIAALSSEYSL